jgi:Rps23 Pro-64 3,4-dihydroxylase Tpa1-like proline 4-hydroxylase
MTFQSDALFGALGRTLVRQLAPALDTTTIPARFLDKERSASKVAPAAFVILEEFLTAQEFASLLDFTLARESTFTDTRVISPGQKVGDVNYNERRSTIVYEFEPFQSLIVDRVQAALPLVLDKLEHPRFPITNIEAQLTATNDGQFFRAHNDSAHEDLVLREITFVYYFCRYEGCFTGGDLRIFDTVTDGGRYSAAETYRTVAPRPNQVVFFASLLMHEVMNTNVPSRAFADSRFTVNGWIHRRA